LCFFAAFDFSKIFPSNVSFCPRMLLDALTAKDAPGPYLIDLFVCLLQLSNPKVTYVNWERHLKELLAEESDADDRRLTKDFAAFTIPQRLRTLYDVCHIVLSISETLRSQVEEKDDMREEQEPFGFDNEGARYWYFQRAGSLSFLKEVEPTFEMKNGRPTNLLSNGSWQILATNSTELAVFTASIATEAEKASTGQKKKEKPGPLSELYKKLVNEALPECELQETLAKRRKRRERTAGLDSSLILDDTTTRSARTKRVCYAELENEHEFDD